MKTVSRLRQLDARSGGQWSGLLVLLLGIIALLLCSCATKHNTQPHPHVNIPRAKIVQEATTVSRSVGDVEKSNSKIQGQLGIAKTRAQDLVSSGRELEAEFAALVSKEAITRAELATANKMWGKYFRDVQTMQNEVLRANDMVNEQAVTIQSLRQDTTRMTVEAAKSSQALDLSIQQSQSYAKQASDNFDSNQKLLARVAVLEAQNGKLKAWLYWVIGFLLVYLLVRYLKWRYNLLRFIP